jgi:hypothetical protein
VARRRAQARAAALDAQLPAFVTPDAIGATADAPVPSVQEGQEES